MTVIDPRMQDSVGAALGSVRQNWRGVLFTAAIGALATTAIQMLGGLAPSAPYLTIAAALFASAMIYSVFIGMALRGGQPRLRPSEGLRVFSAMAVVGFFLAIVGFVLSIVSAIILVAGPYASLSREISAASGDRDAVNRLAQQMFAQNPAPIVVIGVFYLLVWFYLTTRLYLAAPASVDRGRILSFETWSWTKGATLKIMGARAMLIGPAFVLTFALTYLLSRAAGIALFDASGGSPQPGPALAFAIITAFLGYLVSDALSANLSSALYRDLGGLKARLPPS